jgi:hypothetical protein
MQPLGWYARRLASMSPGEVAWRARGALRDATDRGRVAFGWYPGPSAGVRGDAWPSVSLVEPPTGAWQAAGAEPAERAWAAALRTRADALVAHRFSFFDLHERPLGDPVDWNRDHASGRAAPLGFAGAIDYRDQRVTGDAKLVWEPNRHHQLVVLGRAYRATGEARYAAALCEQLDSWLRQCPFGRGMNWRSPLELAVRLINWVYAAELIRDAGVPGASLRERWLHSLELHVWEIARKYSRGSSANNHRIGEAAGVLVATACYPGIPHARRHREESRRILCDEIEAQTFPDGCTREQALGYQLFVLQFFLVAGCVSRRAGEDMPDAYWRRLAAMLDFVAALREGGDALPMFGDADDGYVLDLGAGPGEVSGWLALGAALLGDEELARRAGPGREPVAWLLGRDAVAWLDRVPQPAQAPALASRGFSDSGYYLLQCGRQGGDDAASVLFDCGELGFGSLAAHGHADALSVCVRVAGHDVLVDPGTYDYFSFPAWREYFRSTRAHNTLTLDGLDQSAMLGPFLWGRRAHARCLEWRTDAAAGRAVVIGEHDGYAGLPAPARHRRTLELDARTRMLTIRDEIVSAGPHDVALYFHLAEACALLREGERAYRLTVGGRSLRLCFDPRLAVRSLSASLDPIAGWVSRGYHLKSPATTLVASARCTGDARFECRLELGGRSEQNPASRRA